MDDTLGKAKQHALDVMVERALNRLRVNEEKEQVAETQRRQAEQEARRRLTHKCRPGCEHHGDY